MATTEIKGIFSPRNKRFPVLPNSSAAFIKQCLTLRTLLLGGATAQALLTLIFPSRYALLPTLALLLHTIVSTVHSAVNFPPPVPPSPSPTTTIPGRTSSHLPPSNSNSLFPAPAHLPPGLVTLHLGVRFTHPLGILAPGVRDVGAHFEACNASVLDAAKPYGCIGYSSWNAASQDANNTMMTVYYFRDVEGLNAFAQGEVHRKAWDWYSGWCKDGKGYIGVYHETFEVKEGGWETIAVNMPPTLLGAGSLPVGVEEGEEVWVSPLVEARGRRFKGQWQRMGRGKDGKVE